MQFDYQILNVIKTHKKMQLLTLFPKFVEFKNPKRFQNERKKNQKKCIRELIVLFYF